LQAKSHLFQRGEPLSEADKATLKAVSKSQLSVLILKIQKTRLLVRSFSGPVRSSCGLFPVLGLDLHTLPGTALSLSRRLLVAVLYSLTSVVIMGAGGWGTHLVIVVLSRSTERGLHFKLSVHAHGGWQQQGQPGSTAICLPWVFSLAVVHSRWLNGTPMRGWGAPGWAQCT